MTDETRHARTERLRRYFSQDPEQTMSHRDLREAVEALGALLTVRNGDGHIPRKLPLSLAMRLGRIRRALVTEYEAMERVRAERLKDYATLEGDQPKQWHKQGPNGGSAIDEWNAEWRAFLEESVTLRFAPVPLKDVEAALRPANAAKGEEREAEADYLLEPLVYAGILVEDGKELPA